MALSCSSREDMDSTSSTIRWHEASAQIKREEANDSMESFTWNNHSSILCEEVQSMIRSTNHSHNYIVCIITVRTKNTVNRKTEVELRWSWSRTWDAPRRFSDALLLEPRVVFLTGNEITCELAQWCASCVKHKLMWLTRSLLLRCPPVIRVLGIQVAGLPSQYMFRKKRTIKGAIVAIEYELEHGF